MKTITIEIPLADSDDIRGYQSEHIDMHLSNVEQKEAYKRILIALQQSGATMLNDRRVNSPPDAIRWLFERIHAAIANGQKSTANKGQPRRRPSSSSQPGRKKSDQSDW